MNITVTKRSGRTEPFSNDKVNKPCVWACEGIEGASPSLILMRAKVAMEDGIRTEDIHDALIKAATHLIEPETPEYDIPAGRLLAFQIRKRAYGQYTPPSVYDHVVKMVRERRYDARLTERYTVHDFELMEQAINHDADLNLHYISVKQYEEKYLVQNRVTGELYESPQMALMLIAATLFIDMDPERRMDYVTRFYRATSNGKISLPTPIMAGIRTPTRQFSSCVVVDSGDSLDSINATASAIVKYVSQRAGIGINAGRIRAIGSAIRNGEARHTGVIPFIKHFATAVKSCSQGAVRPGSATLYFPIWHYEAEELLVLKNNRGTEETRCRVLDYGVQFNGYLYERLKKGLNISLFSPSEVPGLYEAFFCDQAEFARLYEQYEADPSIRKKTMKAKELFGIFGGERASTGRMYVQNVDHCNAGPFNPKKATIYLSNLCLEIALPTKPLNDIKDPEGEIALCTLSAFNVGAIEDLSELEELSDMVVRALDGLLDYQDYPVLAGRNGGLERRALGVGVTGFATYLARRGARYSDGSGKVPTHELFEAMQYYLLKASNVLAKEKGACARYGDTTYSEGVLPIDRIPQGFKDAVGEFDLHMPWETLRADIREHGLRNSTVTAIMPCETSSAITNSINGIEPPRGRKSIKVNKDAIMPQLVTDIETLGDQYEYVWEMSGNRGYLDLVAIMQCFVDQSVSANTNYDPAKFENGRVPVSLIMKEMIYAHKIGVKTLYYHNTRDGNEEAAINSMGDGCEGGACKL